MANRQQAKTTFEPERVIRPIHTGGSVALDNGAKILATTLSEDVLLTNPANGKQLARVEGDGELVSTLALTPSGSHLIVCSRSLSMRVYALKFSEDGTLEVTLARSIKPHNTPINVLAVDRTSTLLATGGTDGTLKVWDIVGGFVTHTFRGPSGMVTALHFFETSGSVSEAKKTKNSKKSSKRGTPIEEEAAPQSQTTTRFRLISGSQDGKVRVWDLNKRSVLASLDSHVSDVQGLDYSPRLHTVVTASRDKTTIWWDAKTWQVKRVVPCFELVEAVGFLDDGRLTYTAGTNGCLRIWETESGREVTPDQTAKSEAEGIVSAIYRPGLPFILCVQVDQTMALYRVPAGADTTSLAAPTPFRRISGTHDDIIDLAYLLPDHSILALATNSEDIRLVSVQDEQSEETEDPWSDDFRYFGQDVGLLHGHDDIIITIDVDWSGHWIATGAKDNTARLWRVDPHSGSFDCYAVFTGHAESIGAVGLPRGSPAESSPAFTDPLSHPPLFLVTGSQDQTVKKWEIPRQPQKQTKGGTRAAFTRKAHDKDINAIDVHPLNSLFASSSQDKTVKIWSVEDGEVQGILKGHRRGVWSVKFAPLNTPAIQGEEGNVAGRGVVLTGSGDKTVKIWSLSDYSCIRTFEGHSNSVLKVAWLNPPAKEATNSKRPLLIASAGGDGLVKVWDANSGEVESTLDNHEDRVWALAVHPDTNMIVSGSGDSTVTFWNDTTTETQAAASAAALQLVEQEQELENHIHAGSYREAITLALQLNHPGRLLNLFTTAVTTKSPDKGSLCGLKAVDEVLKNLSDEQIFLLLLRLRDWNTNARTAPVAQRILWTLVRSYPPSRFSGLSVKGARGHKSLRELLDGLRAYTERHYKRMEELVDESYLVEYTLQEMDALAPRLTDDGVNGGLDSHEDVIMAT